MLTLIPGTGNPDVSQDIRARAQLGGRRLTGEASAPEQLLSNRLLNLRGCAPGATVTVCSISPSLCVAQRLRELGIVEGSHVLLLKQEDPVLLLVKDSRIAIDPATASNIFVSHLPQPEPVIGGEPSAEQPVGRRMPVGVTSHRLGAK